MEVGLKIKATRYSSRLSLKAAPMDIGKMKGLLGIPESDKSQDIPLQFIIEDAV